MGSGEGDIDYYGEESEEREDEHVSEESSSREA